MPSEKKAPAPLQVIGLALIGLMGNLVTMCHSTKGDFINECPRFSIGYGITTIGHNQLVYRFTYQERELRGYWYEDSRSLQDYFKGDFRAEKFVGKRFLIRFHCDKPQENLIDWSHSVPPTIKDVPDQGWAYIPDTFPKAIY